MKEEVSLFAVLSSDRSTLVTTTGRDRADLDPRFAAARLFIFIRAVLAAVALLALRDARVC